MVLPSWAFDAHVSSDMNITRNSRLFILEMAGVVLFLRRQGSRKASCRIAGPKLNDGYLGVRIG